MKQIITCRGLAYDVWYHKYGRLLNCIQQKYDHNPNTTVSLTRNKIIVITQVDDNIFLNGLHCTIIPVVYTSSNLLSGGNR